MNHTAIETHDIDKGLRAILSSTIGVRDTRERLDLARHHLRGMEILRKILGGIVTAADKELGEVA